MGNSKSAGVIIQNSPTTVSWNFSTGYPLTFTVCTSDVFSICGGSYHFTFEVDMVHEIKTLHIESSSKLKLDLYIILKHKYETKEYLLKNINCWASSSSLGTVSPENLLEITCTFLCIRESYPSFLTPSMFTEPEGASGNENKHRKYSTKVTCKVKNRRCEINKAVTSKGKGSSLKWKQEKRLLVLKAYNIYKDEFCLPDVNKRSVWEKMVETFRRKCSLSKADYSLQNFRSQILSLKREYERKINSKSRVTSPYNDIFMKEAQLAFEDDRGILGMEENNEEEKRSDKEKDIKDCGMNSKAEEKFSDQSEDVEYCGMNSKAEEKHSGLSEDIKNYDKNSKVKEKRSDKSEDIEDCGMNSKTEEKRSDQSENIKDYDNISKTEAKCFDKSDDIENFYKNSKAEEKHSDQSKDIKNYDKNSKAKEKNSDKSEDMEVCGMNTKTEENSSDQREDIEDYDNISKAEAKCFDKSDDIEICYKNSKAEEKFSDKSKYIEDNDKNNKEEKKCSGQCVNEVGYKVSSKDEERCFDQNEFKVDHDRNSKEEEKCSGQSENNKMYEKNNKGKEKHFSHGEDVEEYKNYASVQPIKLKGLLGMSENFEKTFLDEEDSDVTFKVGDQKYPAHKVIIKVRSPVFRAMLKHDTKEKNEGVINISDCDPLMFRDFLSYIYTGKLDEISSENVFELYRISNKYRVKDLKMECIDFILNNLSVNIICDVISLAVTYSEQTLIARATEFLVEHAQSILPTIKWQTFVEEYPTEANKISFKTFSKFSEK